MRKIVLSIAAAGAALIAASPAAAQYFPQAQPAPYGYNNGNGYNNGYNNGWGQVRALQARLNNLERQINRLDRRDRIGDRNADRLRNEANNIERRLRRAGRNGLNPNEVRDIDVRIARLEQRVQYSLANGYGRGGYDGRGDRRDHRNDD